MRTIAAFAVLLSLGAGLIGCGGDAGEAITARPVDVSVSSASLHDPSGSSATIAVEFRPTPSPTDTLALEVVERSSGDVIAVLPLDRTQERDSCFKARPSPAWELFTIRGGKADDLHLDESRHELRLTIKSGDSEKRFLLDIPPNRCLLIE
jgi:hypothetical protein